MAKLNQEWRIAVLATAVFVLDQVTKVLTAQFLAMGEERPVIEGFFRFVHYGNTGAAYSLFDGGNTWLAIIGTLALVALIYWRRHFESHTLVGQIALGCIIGGILGNILDRFRLGHVVDFLLFYVERRDGGEAAFPAFNVADTAICTGVGLLMIFSLRREQEPNTATAEEQA